MRVLRCEKGTSLVEFAIVLPLLALLIIGLIETGRYAAFAIRISNAARAGAQFAASRPSVTAYNTADIQTAACIDSGFTCTGSGNNVMSVASSVTCSYTDGTSDPSCALPGVGSGIWRIMDVSVTTSATFTSLFQYPLLPSTLPVSATSTLQADEGQ